MDKTITERESFEDYQTRAEQLITCAEFMDAYPEVNEGYIEHLGNLVPVDPKLVGDDKYRHHLVGYCVSLPLFNRWLDRETVDGCATGGDGEND